LIAKDSVDDLLRWVEGGEQVQIQIGKVIPGDGIKKETLAGRRKRFSKRFEEVLAGEGCQKVSGPHHTYEKAKRAT
jgi:hypothetical protein